MRRITSVVVFFVTIVACTALGGSVQERKSFWAFTGPWDPLSDASLRANASKLDVAVTGWIALDSLTGEPLLPSAYADTMRLAPGTPRRFALVTSWHGQGFHARSIRTLGSDSARRAQVAGRIARHAQSMRYTGLVLDFETLEGGDVPAQLAVVRAIADSAKAHGVTTIAVAIPAEPDEAYPTRDLTRVADLVLVMLYDQHWPGSEPGPISAPGWVTRNLTRVVSEADASRVIAALPLLLETHPDLRLLIVGHGPLREPLESRVVLDDSPFVEPLVYAGQTERWCVLLCNRRVARLAAGLDAL